MSEKRDVRHRSYIPGPQKRGTGGTLKWIWKGYPRPGPPAYTEVWKAACPYKPFVFISGLIRDEANHEGLHADINRSPGILRDRCGMNPKQR